MLNRPVSQEASAVTFPECAPLVFWCQKCSAVQVNETNDVIGIHDDVVRFEISMRDAEHGHGGEYFFKLWCDYAKGRFISDITQWNAGGESASEHRLLQRESGRAFLLVNYHCGGCWDAK